MEKPSSRLIEREFLMAGIAAGLIGGVIMALLEMGISYSQGHGFFAPLRLIDGAVRGTKSIAAGPGTEAVVGFLIHLVISACLGGIFAIGYRLFRRLTGMLDAFWAGIAFGIILWGAVRNLFLLFYSHPRLTAILSASPEQWFLAHLAFGAALGLTPILARKFRSREDLRAEAEAEKTEKRSVA